MLVGKVVTNTTVQLAFVAKRTIFLTIDAGDRDTCTGYGVLA